MIIQTVFQYKYFLAEAAFVCFLYGMGSFMIY